MPPIATFSPAALDAIQVSLGLTDEDFAKRMEVSTRTLVNWRKGHVVPPWSKVIRIAERLDVEPKQLIGDQG